MEIIKKTFLHLFLLLICLTSSFKINACNVKVGTFDWDSAQIHTSISTYIMEQGYGCDVQVVKGRTNTILENLIDNKLDIIFEHWTDNNVALIDPELSSGNLIDLGINTPASEQGFFIDKETSETYGITNIVDLKKPDIWKLFKDPEDPSKGRIISCLYGWTCYTINFVKIMEYGLSDLFNLFDPGTATGLDKAITIAFEKKQPIISYYYTPTSLMGKSNIDMVRLEEPSYEKSCWESMMVVVDNIKLYGVDAYEPSCANEYKNMALTKLVTGKFAEANPKIIAFADAYTIATPVVNEILAYHMDESGENFDVTTKYYLQNYSEWETWIPEDIVTKIKSTL